MGEKIKGLVDTFANRLKKAMSIRNIKAIELSEKTGISKSSLSEYINGKYEAKQDGVYLLAKALDVSEPWLMGLDVPMERINRTDTSNVFPLADAPVKLPILGKISAGLPILATENIEGYEFAPSSYIRQGYEYFYLKVTGDSMNLKFNEGDIVLVQKQDYLENGEIGVILVNGDNATIKKFQQKNGFIFLEPMSTNPANQVQIYDPKEVEIKIIGKAVSYQGKLN